MERLAQPRGRPAGDDVDGVIGVAGSHVAVAVVAKGCVQVIALRRAADRQRAPPPGGRRSSARVPRRRGPLAWPARRSAAWPRRGGRARRATPRPAGSSPSPACSATTIAAPERVAASHRAIDLAEHLLAHAREEPAVRALERSRDVQRRRDPWARGRRAGRRRPRCAAKASASAGAGLHGRPRRRPAGDVRRDPLRHRGVAGVGRRDVAHRQAARERQPLGMRALAGARAADEDRQGHGLPHEQQALAPVSSAAAHREKRSVRRALRAAGRERSGREPQSEVRVGGPVDVQVARLQRARHEPSGAGRAARRRAPSAGRAPSPAAATCE